MKICVCFRAIHRHLGLLEEELKETQLLIEYAQHLMQIQISEGVPPAVLLKQLDYLFSQRQRIQDRIDLLQEADRELHKVYTDTGQALDRALGVIESLNIG